MQEEDDDDGDTFVDLKGDIEENDWSGIMWES